MDLSKPAGSFVRDPNEPVVIVYRMDGDDTASEVPVRLPLPLFTIPPTPAPTSTTNPKPNPKPTP